MPTILFVSYSGVFGGAEQVLLDATAAVVPDALLACPEGPLADRARDVGVPVLGLPTRTLDLRAGVVGRLRAAANLAAHARELHGLHRSVTPALTVAWGMRSALASLALPHGVRLVVAHQDFLPGAGIARGVRAACARADAVCVPSAAVAADLDPEGALGARLRVIAPGVDPERFAGIGAPPDDDGVLVLGALAAWKRPELALEAVAIARRSLPGLRLVFVGAPVTGGDDPTPELQERARHPDLAGSVSFAGASDDPRNELAAAACVLHCSPREPFGIVLLEAGAAARPVVAPDAAGPAEIIDASSGVLYSPGDARAAARALVAVLGDPARARALGAGGRARVSRRYGHARTRGAFASVLTPLTGTETCGPVEGPSVALVTVTHNSAIELAALLASVDRHLPEAEVICVDCASADDSVAVAAAHPRALSIALSENVGFGAACNRGLEHVGAPVTVLVNPDVVLIDGSLRALAAEAARPGAPERLLAPALLKPDGGRQDSAHPAPGSVAALVATLVPSNLAPGFAGAFLAPWRARRPRRVGWAIGAALAAPTGTLRRLGPFDASIFLYGEDLELGLRAGRAGVTTWLWPTARVIHTGAHATAGAFGGEDIVRLARARHAAIARVLGEPAARRDDLAQALTFASRGTLKRLLRRGGERERRQLAAVRDLRRG